MTVILQVTVTLKVTVTYTLKFAVLDYNIYLELKEIIEDFLDHIHAESVIENTNKNDWVDFQDVKKELGIR